MERLVGNDQGAAMSLLLDLRYDSESVREILREMLRWRDSTAYQFLVEEGRAKGLAEGRTEGLAEGRAEGGLIEARRLVMSFGTDRFGPPDAATRETIEHIDDLERLERLIGRAFSTSNWQDLLAEA